MMKVLSNLYEVIDSDFNTTDIPKKWVIQAINKFKLNNYRIFGMLEFRFKPPKSELFSPNRN